MKIFLMLFILLGLVGNIFPSELSQKLSGKWSGNILTEIKSFGPKGEVIGRGKSSIEIIDITVQKYEEREPSAEENQIAKISGFAPILTSFSGWAKFSALTEFLIPKVSYLSDGHCQITKKSSE